LPVTKFLFWNINRKPLAALVAELAEIHRVDVIILAECDNNANAVLRDLNHTASSFHLSAGPRRRIVVFTRFSRAFLQPAYGVDWMSIFRLELPRHASVLLAAAHLPSKRYSKAADQENDCRELAKRIESEEKKAGHQRTILVGDFNMDPFEIGLVADLSSVMSRRVAASRTRTVQTREHRLFYNPMWNHLGDSRGDTAGSYFYNSGMYVNYYWHVFDQVMLRPDLASSFDQGSIKILKEIGTLSLVRPDGRPDRRTGSDHLPLLFEVEF
jgi:hypothetical protein